ncbi:MAG: sigma-70 family RNA polymerase sigma factor [Ignavibacteriales bacterium]|nr:sigma-70 family RNA polymerase sigma factor [Ignavibacteriales bacterium]
MSSATQQLPVSGVNGYDVYLPDISRDKLILQYFGLVKYVLRHMNLSRGGILTRNDLLHFGILGLNEALDHFDPTKGVKFETYAIPRIKGRILDELRKLDWVPRSVRQKMKATNVTSEREEQLFNHLFKNVAHRLSFSTAEYSKLYDEAQKLISDESSNQEVSHAINLDEIIDDSASSPFEIIVREEDKQVIADMIEQLPKKHRLVIALFYYEELSFSEIAEVLRLSISRVSQLHTEAVSLLKKELILVA